MTQTVLRDAEEAQAGFPAALARIGDHDGPLELADGHRLWYGDRIKRSLDFLLAALGLFLSSPLWVAIATAIKCEDRGPIFFHQERVGRGGKVFRVRKFRSMIPNAEHAVGPMQSGFGDPRITRLGQLLRATALDELPQLLSILQGHMSFVGPRALRPGEIEVNGNGECVPLEAIAGYHERHSVLPGLTGLAQVYAPRDIPRHQKFRFDVLYVRSRSVWLDLRLIAVSLWISVRGRWEDRQRKF